MTFVSGLRVQAVTADLATLVPVRYPTLADGHDELLVCEAIAASAREGRRVEAVRDRVEAGS